MDPAGTTIWILETSALSEMDLRAVEAILSPEESTRARKFHVASERVEYLAAHGLARIALGRAADCSAEDLQFAIGPHGRPCVSAPQRAAALSFNLSHTGGLVGVAISSGGPVGLDVERSDRVVDMFELLQLARHILTKAEIQALSTLGSSERRHRFCQLWTLKEAYLKARGLGLVAKLNSFSFELKGSRLRFHPPPDDTADWGFHSKVLGSVHCLAACFKAWREGIKLHDGTSLLREYRKEFSSGKSGAFARRG